MTLEERDGWGYSNTIFYLKVFASSVLVIMSMIILIYYAAEYFVPKLN